jgi:hypothetical protein
MFLSKEIASLPVLPDSFLRGSGDTSTRTFPLEYSSFWLHLTRRNRHLSVFSGQTRILCLGFNSSEFCPDQFSRRPPPLCISQGSGPGRGKYEDLVARSPHVLWWARRRHREQHTGFYNFHCNGGSVPFRRAGATCVAGNTWQ